MSKLMLCCAVFEIFSWFTMWQPKFCLGPVIGSVQLPFIALAQVIGLLPGWVKRVSFDLQNPKLHETCLPKGLPRGI